MSIVRRYRVAIAVVYLLGLFTLTLAPLPQTAMQLASAKGFDKAVHFGLLGGLACVLYWMRLPAGPPSSLVVVGGTSAVAALIELLQAPLSYRTADVWDFLWGAAGGVVAYLVLRWLDSRR